MSRGSNQIAACDNGTWKQCCCCVELAGAQVNLRVNFQIQVSVSAVPLLFGELLCMRAKTPGTTLRVCSDMHTSVAPGRQVLRFLRMLYGERACQSCLAQHMPVAWQFSKEAALSTRVWFRRAHTCFHTCPSTCCNGFFA